MAARERHFHMSGGGIFGVIKLNRRHEVSSVPRHI